MKKRILSLVLTFSILLSALPLNVLTVFAGNNILYGDADGNGKVELLDVNLMERYIEGDEDAKADIHFTEADVNADGAVDDTDVQMVKDYLVGNLDSLTRCTPSALKRPAAEILHRSRPAMVIPIVGNYPLPQGTIMSSSTGRWKTGKPTIRSPRLYPQT